MGQGAHQTVCCNMGLSDLAHQWWVVFTCPRHHTSETRIKTRVDFGVFTRLLVNRTFNYSQEGLSTVDFCVLTSSPQKDSHLLHNHSVSQIDADK